jgi:hypothetical protein
MLIRAEVCQQVLASRRVKEGLSLIEDDMLDAESVAQHRRDPCVFVVSWSTVLDRNT